jgi:hypothetical protein
MADKKQTGGQNISSGRDHQHEHEAGHGPEGSSKIYHDEGSQGTGGQSGRSKANDDPADARPGKSKKKPA